MKPVRLRLCYAKRFWKPSQKPRGGRSVLAFFSAKRTWKLSPNQAARTTEILQHKKLSSLPTVHFYLFMGGRGLFEQAAPAYISLDYRRQGPKNSDQSLQKFREKAMCSLYFEVFREHLS